MNCMACIAYKQIQGAVLLADGCASISYMFLSQEEAVPAQQGRLPVVLPLAADLASALLGHACHSCSDLSSFLWGTVGFPVSGSSSAETSFRAAASTSAALPVLSWTAWTGLASPRFAICKWKACTSRSGGLRQRLRNGR